MADLAFAPEEEAAIIRHMNGDHPEDSVLICRALGGQPGTTEASVTGVDRAGITFNAATGAGPVDVRVPWAHQLTARAEVRGEVVRIYREACERLGVAPREAEGGRH
jgi:hypothetical protein